MYTKKHTLALLALTLIMLSSAHTSFCSQQVSNNDQSDKKSALLIGAIGCTFLFFARVLGIPTVHGYTLKNDINTSHINIHAHLQKIDSRNDSTMEQKKMDETEAHKAQLDTYVKKTMGYGTYITGIKGIQHTTKARKKLALLEQCLEESIKKHGDLSPFRANKCFRKSDILKTK